MNAIFYVLRTGMPWRDLPERYGPYTTAYNRFNRWSRELSGEVGDGVKG
jgi:transposase